MKVLYYFVLLMAMSGATVAVHAQAHIDQNQLKSSVIESLFAADADASRFEIATVGYNSHHWQSGGTIIIELFQVLYAPSYQKYVLNNGYGQGANSGQTQLNLIESYGLTHLAKVALGTAADIGTSNGGFPNKGLPVYVDMKRYAMYKVRITYMQNRVETVNDHNQIKLNMQPTAQLIPDFEVPVTLDLPLTTSGQLLVSGDGNHYISNGNLGLGTTTPDERLTVNGTVRAKEMKVDAGPWPDYVFEKDYDLLPLSELAAYIEQHGHLPDVPKAAVVEKDGIALGEMNTLLLKKVEELTLHLIAKDKEIQELKQMREEIDELKKKVK